MATFYSTEYNALYVAAQRTAVHRNKRNTPHLVYWTYTQAANGAQNDIVYLCKVPGVCRLMMMNSWIAFSAWATNQTVDFGWLAYTEVDGDAVAANAAGLLANLDVDAAGEWTHNMLITAGGVARAAAAVYTKEFNSREDVTLTMTFDSATTPTATDTFEGCFVYLL